MSKNFDSSEFRCGHCGTLVGPDAGLVSALQRLRDEVGKPLHIISGTRCRWWNEHVGGMRRSEHLYGRAVDIPGGYATADQCRRAGFHGVGIRRAQVVHVDMTPGRGYFTFKD